MKELKFGLAILAQMCFAIAGCAVILFPLMLKDAPTLHIAVYFICAAIFVVFTPLISRKIGDLLVEGKV